MLPLCLWTISSQNTPKAPQVHLKGCLWDIAFALLGKKDTSAVCLGTESGSPSPGNVVPDTPLPITGSHWHRPTSHRKNSNFFPIRTRNLPSAVMSRSTKAKSGTSESLSESATTVSSEGISCPSLSDCVPDIHENHIKTFWRVGTRNRPTASSGIL